MKTNFRTQILFGLVTLIAVLIAFSSATYAWFTLTNDTNVEPLEGGIGYGEGNLVIANSPEGPFSNRCELNAPAEDVLLRPLSTADLQTFYTAKAHDSSGISTSFAENKQYAGSALCGTVYLKSEQEDSGVYFSPAALNMGNDAQALASLRLGLVFTTSRGVYTHIFKLDDMGDTAGAEVRQTVEQPGCVIASVDAAGRPEFVSDPAANLSDYFVGGDPDALSAGKNLLCILPADEAVRVDYYLYLEGCDENCINVVQGRELALALGFSGITMSELSM
ncbi:MAG: hypothetical protein PUB32_04345 [Clostridiales bacterium]|nr:hypothetical protein [Clostridiales bacterium]